MGLPRHFLLLLLFTFQAVLTGNVIRLDVGGTVFKSSKYTLMKLDGTLKTIIEGIDTDQTTSIFIDRSPEHFDTILNYLRDESVDLPDSMEDCKEILREAEYYQLEGLIEQCNARIPAIGYDINVIESDEDLLEIITSPEKPVLVFYYPVSPTGKVRYPEDLDAKSFLDKYDDTFDIYFKPYKLSRGDREEWQWSLHKGTTRGDFKYQRHNYPKQSFLELFEDSVRGF